MSKSKILKNVRWYYPVTVISIAIVVVIGIIYIFNKPVVVEATWWNDTWSYRQSISVTNGSGGALTDFQVQILNNVDLSGLSPAKLQASLADLRFTDINHRVLPYWIEDNTISSANVWIKMPSIPTTGTIIYMYYGNSSATDVQSGDDTFEFFESFDNLPNWEQSFQTSSYSTDRGTWTVSSGELISDQGSVAQYRALQSNYSLSSTFVIESDIKFSTSISGQHSGINFYGQTDAANNGYQWIIRPDTNQTRIQLRDGGNQSYMLYGDSLTLTLNQWYGAKMVYDGTNITTYIDGVQEMTGVFGDSTYTTGTLGIQIYKYKDYFDNLRVRKFVTTEPSSASPSSEENAPGPIMYLNFDEGFGTTAYDSTGYGNDGTLANSPTWIQNGVSGRAVNFDGTNDSVTIGTNKSLIISDTITMSAWVNLDSYTAGGTNTDRAAIIIKAYSYYMSVTSATGKLASFFYGVDPTHRDSNSQIPLNEWTHVAITYDGSNIKWYIDGVLDKTYSATGTITDLDRDLAVGMEVYNNYGRALNGSIDEVRIYDRALDINEVRQLYNMNAGSFSTGRSELPISCMDQLAQNSGSRSGVYTIDPGPGVDPFDVYCDMETDGGGWTLCFSYDSSAYDSSNWPTIAAGRNKVLSQKWGSSSLYGDGTKQGNFCNTMNITAGNTEMIAEVVKVSDSTVLDTSTYSLNENTFFTQTHTISTGDYDCLIDSTGTKRFMYANYTAPSKMYNGEVLTGCTGTANQHLNKSVGVQTHSYGVDGLIIYSDVITGSTPENNLSTLVNWYSDTGTETLYTTTGDTTQIKFGVSATWYENAYGRSGSSPGLNQCSSNCGHVNKPNNVFKQRMWVRNNAETSTGGVVLDLPFENVSGSTTYDVSGNANNGMVTGATQKSAVNCKIGKCFEFDGTSSDFIQTPISGTYDQITFSFWGFFDDPGLDIYSRNESAFGDWNSSRVHFGTRWSVGMHWNVNSSWTEIPSANIVYGWNHYGLVYNTVTNEKLVYINGLLSLSDTTSGSMVIGDFKIGNATSLNYYYRGKLDEFKVFDRALTQREIMMEMNGGKHQPVLDIGFDEGGGDIAYDKSGFSNNGDLYGACPGATTCPTWKTPENCVNGSCLSFDGTDDYVDLSAVSVAGATSGTVAAWVNAENWDANRMTIFSSEVGPSWNNLRLVLFSNSNNSLTFSVANGSSSISDSVNTGTILSADRWYYVVGTYDGVNVKIFIDGMQKDSYATSITPGTFTPIKTVIGWHYSDRYWNGSIDEVKLYNYALTVDEIKQEYAQSAGQFGRTNSVGDKTTPGASCMDILQKNSKSPTGRYWVDPSGGSQSDALEVYCDMEYDGGGWTLLGLDFAYVNSTWLPFTTYGDISANGANTTNLITSGAGSNYMYMQKVIASDYTFDEFWTGKLNTANIIDKDTDTQIQITLSGQSWPPNAKTGATNVYSNTWCSSWNYGDATNRFELWLGEDSTCGAYSATSGNIPRRIYKDGSKLAWNGNGDTGTSTDNNFGYLFGRNSAVTPNSTAPLLDMDLDQYVSGVYLDRSGNGATGTPSGNPEWKTTVNCKSGRCVEFDSNDYINWGGSIDNGTTTVTTWFNSTYTGKQGLFSFSAGGNTATFWFDWSVNKPLLYLAGSNYRYWSDVVEGYMDGNWHFLEMYLPGSGQTDIINAVLRIDNEIIPASSTTSSAVQDTWTDFYIGEPTTGFRGLVDEMKVFNRELTRGEVAKLYNGGAPVGWWRFDEGADNLCSDGKDVCDNSGEGNNGTKGGDAAWVTDSSLCKQSSCISFDGNGDYFAVASDPALTNITDEITIALWVKPAGTGDKELVNKKYDTSYFGYRFRQNSLNLQFQIGNGSVNKDKFSSGGLTVGQWTHVLVTYDREYVKFYINGELNGSPQALNDVMAAEARTLTLGNYPSHVSYQYNGDMDDVRIYNYALTDKQVKEVMNYGSVYIK